MKTLINKMIVVLTAILFNFPLYSQTGKQVLVSADKMNILYVGIDNPVSIVAQGITSDKLKVTMTNGTITGSNGKYIAKPVQGSISIIEVTTEIKPGEIKKIGCDTFRIKRIPDPITQIGNTTNTNLYSKEYLIKNPEINVLMNLPFDLKFEIISFTFLYKINNEIKDIMTINVTGNKFTQEIIAIINSQKTDSRLYFEDIKAKGPDGTVRVLSPIAIKLSDK
jgi:gliding motility-associated protein GldM